MVPVVSADSLYSGLNNENFVQWCGEAYPCRNIMVGFDERNTRKCRGKGSK
jgi:hypothetical protein